MIKRWLAVLLLGVAACSGGGHGDASKEGKAFFRGKIYPPYRYRVTVVVDTPQGERRGSMVGETRMVVLGDWAIDSPRAARRPTCAEAIPVALPNGKLLFALMVGDSPLFHGVPSLSSEQFIEKHKTNPVVDLDYKYAQIQSFKDKLYLAPKERELPNGTTVLAYPDFVTFDNLSEPKSVRKVDPLDLGKAFGKGYRLSAVYIERTNDPVTHRIANVLPWLTGMETALDGESATFKDDLANQLSPLNFLIEFCKKY